MADHGIDSNRREDAPLAASDPVPLRIPAPRRIEQLTVEASGMCNLKCAGCRRTTENIDLGRGTRKMTLEKFQSILTVLPPIDGLVFAGEGEPTLNAELPEMIAYAKDSKGVKTITVITNLVSRSIDYYVQLAARGMTNLSISIDSLQQDVADLLRFGTSTEKLKPRLAALADRLDVPILVMIAVGKVNQVDVFKTLEELNQLGRFLVMTAEYMDKGKPEWCQTDDEKKEFVLALARRAKEFPNLTIGFPSFIDPAEGTCQRPWGSPGVNVDGYLTPCCSSFSEDIFGETLIEGDWSAIWSKEDVQTWMNDFAHERGAAAELCEKCLLNPRRNLGLVRRRPAG